MSRTEPDRVAVLLIGPTGAGKSPLGDLLAERGLWGRRARHFDFGGRLRRAVREAGGSGLSPAEIAFLREVLDSGRLLEDGHFGIAEKVLRAFLNEGPASAPEWVVLNGMPRHVGQAKALEPILPVAAVIELDCDAVVARRRLATDAGGDRAGREDDSPQVVEGRLATYRQRTRPLVEHYRGQGLPVLSVPVSADSTAQGLYEEIQRRQGPC